MKKSAIAIVLGISVISVSSCNPNLKTSEKTDNAEQNMTNTEEQTVEFKTAENYFVKNTIKETVPTKITTQTDFDKYFGMATTMGENGKPTPIDFSKEFVIVVDHPETSLKTEITPISLEEKGSDVVLNYTITEGEDAGFTIRPFVMIIVNKDSDGNVILQKN